MDIKYRKELKRDQLLRVVTDYNAGLSIKDITKRYAISRQTLYRWLKYAKQSL